MAEEKEQRKYSSEDITAPDYVDPDEKSKITAWIHTVLDIQNNNDIDLFEEIKSGIILCKLLNKIKPNTINTFKESSIAFFQRENIQKFIAGSIEIGLDKIDTFDTNDLYEKQRLSSVIKHLFALHEKAKHIGFDGPFIEDLERQKKEQQSMKSDKEHNTIISFKNTPIIHVQDYSVNFDVDKLKFNHDKKEKESDNEDDNNSSLSDMENTNDNLEENEHESKENIDYDQELDAAKSEPQNISKEVENNNNVAEVELDLNLDDGHKVNNEEQKEAVDIDKDGDIETLKQQDLYKDVDNETLDADAELDLKYDKNVNITNLNEVIQRKDIDHEMIKEQNLQNNIEVTENEKDIGLDSHLNDQNNDKLEDDNKQIEHEVNMDHHDLLQDVEEQDKVMVVQNDIDIEILKGQNASKHEENENKPTNEIEDVKITENENENVEVELDFNLNDKNKDPLDNNKQKEDGIRDQLLQNVEEQKETTVIHSDVNVEISTEQNDSHHVENEIVDNEYEYAELHLKINNLNERKQKVDGELSQDIEEIKEQSLLSNNVDIVQNENKHIETELDLKLKSNDEHIDSDKLPNVDNDNLEEQRQSVTVTDMNRNVNDQSLYKSKETLNADDASIDNVEEKNLNLQNESNDNKMIKVELDVNTQNNQPLNDEEALIEKEEESGMTSTENEGIVNNGDNDISTCNVDQVETNADLVANDGEKVIHKTANNEGIVQSIRNENLQNTMQREQDFKDTTKIIHESQREELITKSDSTNTLLIIGGIAVIGVALFMAMKKTSLF